MNIAAVRRAAGAQPRLSLHHEALREREYAVAAEAVDGEGCGGADHHLLCSWHAGPRRCVRGKCLHEENGGKPTAAVLDPSGAIGHLYDAKTTPNRSIIDPSGKLIYAGAIDDHATTDVSDIPSSKNYVSAALTEAMAGQPVQTAYTRPYGCSVKYAQ